MSSLKRDRELGKRGAVRHGGKSLLAPSIGTNVSEGEQRLNIHQVYAIENLAQTCPAVHAARTVLLSQLLSGGVTLLRGGQRMRVVKFGQKEADGSLTRGITEDWASHLEEHWLPFARDVIDSYLKWGICAVVIEEAPGSSDYPGENAPWWSTNTRRQKSKATLSHASRTHRVCVPHVPHLGTYEVAWSSTGRYGYVRQYVLYNNGQGNTAATVDESALVFVRQHPDQCGNVNSPLSTVYEMSSFASSLREMAFTAELSRSHPSMVTQARKEDRQTEMAAGSLFFDSESRNLQASEQHEEGVNAAKALQLQATLARTINEMQTKIHTRSQQTGQARQAFQHPDVQPRLFTLPKGQELAPHTQVPQPRNDLEALMRLSMDQCAGAMGVPSSLLFEGRYSGNSSQQLTLLNSTVSQLAKSVDAVLTKTYNALYGMGDTTADPPAQLKLATAPLSATDDLVKLFSSNIADVESVLPAALHSLGATPEEVDSALKRVIKRKGDDEATGVEAGTVPPSGRSVVPDSDDEGKSQGASAE